MSSTVQHYDAVVIGGGFYGVTIALYLVRKRGFSCVALLEREGRLLSRASYHNQARVHNGYHYPRSYTTAYRSRINLPRFLADWPTIVKTDFPKLYAIARRNSKVTAKQFTRFCHEIGASVAAAPLSLKRLFNPRLVEDVFLVEEYAFNSALLAQWAEEQLAAAGVKVHLNTTAVSLNNAGEQDIFLKAKCGVDEHALTASYAFNCSYSGLNHLQGDFPKTTTRLKHEVTEMALVELPRFLPEIGVTVMDGPFFSIMPFPARNLHTLSHVRYTPHFNWADVDQVNPYRTLENYERNTRAERMIRDVSRYMPAMAGVVHRDSLFEVKTILQKNEHDDGRPILFERHPLMPRCYSVLGGKIDNIYDVLEKLDSEAFDPINTRQMQGINP